jgi:hypothetical protein
MRKRVTYSNGTTAEIDESEVIFIRNYPVSDTPKPGYERTRDYPPEWSKFTPLRAAVLVVGHYVSTGGQVLQVTDVADATDH